MGEESQAVDIRRYIFTLEFNQTPYALRLYRKWSAGLSVDLIIDSTW